MSPSSRMPAPPPPPTGVLTVELVPSSCWFSNVRTVVSAADWDKCKDFVRARSGSLCEVCGGRGRRWPVECHEVWRYDLPTEVQHLDGLVALCPDCHGVKHFGYSQSQGKGAALMLHLARVNRWDLDRCEKYLESCFMLWHARNQVHWELDISYLSTIGIDHTRYETPNRDENFEVTFP